MKTLAAPLVLALAVLLSACAGKPPSTPAEVSRLAAALEALDPGVDPEEARRAAAIAYGHSSKLAEDYGVTTTPILHNTMVNTGVKERGLCVHYAEDMQKRLNQENFQTLTLLRAIAEPRNEFRIDHSTAVIAAKGDGIYEGIVLDPWRYGGALYWSPTRADPRYDWEPQMEVLRRKYERKVARDAVAG
ncbi:hypothetical protein [Cribrihabitans pelagius]|uniref:hypothetical protein n=1 Tax=Cribrihabitans pelagius TaxID=1765746 RepID=UPI003B5B3F1C